MNNEQAGEGARALFAAKNFDIADLDDEIRADRLCGDFLKHFYLELVDEQGMEAEQASALAYGADYFLREFIIGDRRENIFRLADGRVRQFAGNWYIVKNMEPNLAELEGMLAGIGHFYRYASKVGQVEAELLEQVEHDCAALDYYRERIETFWDLQDDGYFAWNRQCPIED